MPSPTCVGVIRLHRTEFPHSEILGSKLACQLPEAYRRLRRPSSACHVKASTICPCCPDLLLRFHDGPLLKKVSNLQNRCVSSTLVSPRRRMLSRKAVFARRRCGDTARLETVLVYSWDNLLLCLLFLCTLRTSFDIENSKRPVIRLDVGSY